jgi:hypothetical protein
MPYIIKPRRVRNIALASFAATLLIGVLPAAANADWFTHTEAGAECPSRPTSSVFKKYADNAEYSLVPGGAFEESTAPGWSLDGAEVASAEELEGGSHALVIQPGGVAVSPGFCVSEAYPSFRFLARQISGGGSLNVRLRWRDRWGWSHETSVASLQTGSSWVLSPALELASKLTLWMRGSTLTVQLVFESGRGEGESGRGEGFDRGSGGTWAIDDVYVDPYRR